LSTPFRAKEYRSMRSKKLSIGLTAVLAILMVTLLATATRAFAQQETVLYNFGTHGKDSRFTFASVVFDTAGNLYATAFNGGIYGLGTVFELTPNPGGSWDETIIHSFGGSAQDGTLPHANLIFDAIGNLYSTTYYGGAYNDGTVFELTPRPGGGWMEKILHNFNGGDGQAPLGGLIFDSAGNLYGTTSGGGSQGGGTAFELTPNVNGGWTERVLHNFDQTDGHYPFSSLIFDTAGNLYGTTQVGGAYNGGTVFELRPAVGKGWAEKVLYSFNGTAGTVPDCSLIFDAAGNLYGTAAEGGAYNAGTVFELMPTVGDNWTLSVLHTFDPLVNDGVEPSAGLIFDASGNLYGTTYYGGTYGAGTAFELTPTGGGNWTETVLNNFNYSGGKGIAPYASLILDSAGNLYGTTYTGGVHGHGTVFEITP
jgi:uncharacterized repeat protein (TIGR03803 family)